MLSQGFYRISNQEYHNGIGVFAESKSSLANILSPPTGDGSPKKFKHKKTEPELDIFHEKAKKFNDGTGLHAYFGEPEKFDKEIVVYKPFSGPGSVALNKDLKQSIRDSGQTPINQDIMAMLKDFDNLLHSGEHEEARKIIEHPDRFVEYSGFWQDPDTKIWLKTRPDNIASNIVIWELKKHTSIKSFQSQAMSLHYDLQAYMALEGCTIITKALNPDVPAHTDFGFIIFHAREKPYDIEIVMADRDFIESGRNKFYTAILTLQACRDNEKKSKTMYHNWLRWQEDNRNGWNVWPGKYEDKIGWLSPTSYRLKQLEMKKEY